MVYDLLEWFLTCRSVSLQIIKSKGDWRGWARESLREKGTAVLAYFQLTAPEAEVFQLQRTQHCGFTDEDIEDDELWHGRQSGALERLFKLMGVIWVDYQDVQMHLLKMPVNFIYHKKKLKSVGLNTFEKQLKDAAGILNVLSSLSEEVRFFLLYFLDHLGGAVRVYGFHDLAASLKHEESIKLLLYTFQAFCDFFGKDARGGLVTFGPLSQSLNRRHEVLQKFLSELPFPTGCFEGMRPFESSPPYGGLQFESNPQEQAVRVDYKDTIQFDQMTQSLTTVWNLDDLENHYQDLVNELKQKLPYDTRSFEEELRRVYDSQRTKVNDLILKSFQGRLKGAQTFEELQEIQGEIMMTLNEVSFTEEQKFLLREMFEFHRSRTRDRYLEEIYRVIHRLSTREDLSAYWNSLKKEFLPYRAFLGKEYESLIAQIIDLKMEEF